MPNTRENLVELLEGLYVDYGATAIFFTKGWAEVIADHLIANGVTIPVRCKACEQHIETKAENVVYCKKFNRFMKVDDFCSYGERKE